jgi:acetyl-CoA C-acetyltransferase
MRSTPGQFGLVGANGGILSKYSVGVYSTTPGDWAADGSRRLQDEIAGWRKAPATEHPDGLATIETYTVRNEPSRRTGVIFGRLESDGSRFLANTVDGDDKFRALLTDEDPIGARISVRSLDYGNRAVLV